jgi:hypothetical protein
VGGPSAHGLLAGRYDVGSASGHAPHLKRALYGVSQAILPRSLGR